MTVYDKVKNMEGKRGENILRAQYSLTSFRHALTGLMVVEDEADILLQDLENCADMVRKQKQEVR